MNSGVLDPSEGILLLTVENGDLSILPEGKDRSTICLVNFKGGIEIVWEHDRTWWPV